MRILGKIQRGGVLVLGICSLMVVLLGLPASADRMTSTNFVLNGNVNGSFGGQSGSTSYGMFSTGGESIIGKGASGSYMLGEGFTAQSEKSIQLTVQPGGLLGYWNLDETTGTLSTDSSTTLAHGNWTGTGLAAGTGKINGGLTFTRSGAGDDNTRVVVPGASIQPSSITLETWVKPTVMSAWDNIIGYNAKPAENDGPWELYVDGAHTNGTDGHFRWQTRRTGSDCAIDTHTASYHVPNAWYHVVATYDSATGLNRIYVNGVKEGETTCGAGVIDYSYGNTNQEISFFNNPRWPGEGVQGTLDHVKIFNRALRDDEVLAEYTAQNAGIATGVSLGTVTPGTSNTALQDVIVRTDSGEYGVVLSQDHNLQKGAATIPAISSSIASPGAWSEGTTKGLGFTLVSAPGLDGKWSTGANYAAIPGSATSFYARSGHASSDTIDTISSRLRLDTTTAQEAGLYSNTVTYTGTTIP
jgi:hypothetical protein